MNNNDLGKKIKKAILDSGLSQKDLSKKTGIKQQVLSDWVNGRRNPKIEALKKIAKATRVPLNFFVDNSENMITNAGDNAIIGKNQTVINSSDIELLKKDVDLQKKEMELLKLQIELLKKDKKK